MTDSSKVTLLESGEPALESASGLWDTALPLKGGLPTLPLGGALLEFSTVSLVLEEKQRCAHELRQAGRGMVEWVGVPALELDRVG